MKSLLVSCLLILNVPLLSAEQAWVASSKVGELKGLKGQVTLFGIQEDLTSLSFELNGEGADSFVVANERREEDGLLFFEVEFKPTSERGFFEAELKVGAGDAAKLVQLRGVATKALEGKNEPPLQELMKALGTGIDVGGTQLSLSTKEDTIGDSVIATQFEAVKGAEVKVTPLARYSPPGKTPFGLVTREGDGIRLATIGNLAVTTAERPDAHQTLWPPLVSGQDSVAVVEPPERFGLFLKAHRYTSLTFPGLSEDAPIKHTSRIFPVKQFQGKVIENAYVVGFEEASNGDYQDAVFLIEGVKTVK